MSICFTADTHWCHDKLRTMQPRPMADVIEMNELMIIRWNLVVQPSDTIYHLGDFSLGGSVAEIEDIFNRLNGHKILIKGNHDEKNNKILYRLKWENIRETQLIRIEDKFIWLSHYAHRSWPHSHVGSYHLYGHSHGNLPNLGKSMDVGVDTHNYYPYTWQEIKSILDPVPYSEPQHLGEEREPFNHLKG